jgi:hypothetical protein
MREGKILKAALTLSLVFALVSVPFLLPVHADTPTEPHAADAIWVEPLLIDLSTPPVSVGYKFNVTVFINLTVSSASWEFKLAYNKNHLNATGTGYTAGAKSDFFRNLTTLSLTPLFGSLNATHDYVLSAEAWLMGPTRGPGYGSLSWVEFEVTAVPPSGENYTSAIALTDLYPEGTQETYAQQPDGTKVSLSASSSTYRISSAAGPPPPGECKLYVDPPEIIDPTMGPSSLFVINITVANVSDMKICSFNLTYDSGIIGFFGVNLFKVQNQAPSPRMILDNEAGFIWIELTYPTSVSTVRSPLVAITFHVEAYGSTILDLQNTQITNSTGQPISHQEEDGFFATLIRDVAIVNVYPSRNWTYEGYSINITVVAANLGMQNETFTVTARCDNTEIGNYTVPNLPSGADVTIIFAWDANGASPCHNYTLSAEASIVPYEINITNNEFFDGQVTIRLLGDLNGDGNVRIDDVLIVASAFGSQPGHPRWNPNADVNGDEKVRIDDVLLVARNFGKSCLP